VRGRGLDFDQDCISRNKIRGKAWIVVSLLRIISRAQEFSSIGSSSAADDFYREGQFLPERY
jgi:hypothetical protein